ncbi:uncharacterized protein LOC128241495 [Mya arenaria]|uniref:uncharacterized protein LOC128241495 n=1 Tax=Mya arenaria TaxID=6604 RepID=UPI0022E468B0|nr:uncharacterized protein LOC128241495 [Mya arenaria]XP_052814408.1 uncharacterized protein LOC128241495 [Mya arenaria]
MGNTVSKVLDVTARVVCVATNGALGKSDKGYHLGPLRFSSNSIGLEFRLGPLHAGVFMTRRESNWGCSADIGLGYDGGEAGISVDLDSKEFNVRPRLAVNVGYAQIKASVEIDNNLKFSKQFVDVSVGRKAKISTKLSNFDSPKCEIGVGFDLPRVGEANINVNQKAELSGSMYANAGIEHDGYQVRPGFRYENGTFEPNVVVRHVERQENNYPKAKPGNATKAKRNDSADDKSSKPEPTSNQDGLSKPNPSHIKTSELRRRTRNTEEKSTKLNRQTPQEANQAKPVALSKQKSHPTKKRAQSENRSGLQSRYQSNTKSSERKDCELCIICGRADCPEKTT